MSARGLSFHGAVTMIAADPSGLLTTAESARLARVARSTLRDWRRKGYLAPQGLDASGYPLHSAEAVRAAEELARQHGIQASGIDPRLLRQRPAA